MTPPPRNLIHTLLFLNQYTLTDMAKVVAPQILHLFPRTATPLCS